MNASKIFINYNVLKISIHFNNTSFKVFLIKKVLFKKEDKNEILILII